MPFIVHQEYVTPQPFVGSYKSSAPITSIHHSLVNSKANLQVEKKEKKTKTFTEITMASSLLSALLIALATAQVALAIYFPSCDPPHRPDNGGYNSSSNKYTAGSRINFFCNAGYRLHGVSSTICKHVHKKSFWAHKTPVCKCELHVHTHAHYHYLNRYTHIAIRVHSRVFLRHSGRLWCVKATSKFLSFTYFQIKGTMKALKSKNIYTYSCDNSS